MRHIELDQMIDPEVHRLAKMYDDYIASCEGMYEPCLNTGKYLEELIHWLHYHRWFKVVELKRIFRRNILWRIRKLIPNENCHPIFRRGVGVDRILRLEYTCHPTLSTKSI